MRDLAQDQDQRKSNQSNEERNELIYYRPWITNM